MPLDNNQFGSRSPIHDFGIVVDEFGRYHKVCKRCGFDMHSAYLTCPGPTINTLPATAFSFRKLSGGCS